MTRRTTLLVRALASLSALALAAACTRSEGGSPAPAASIAAPPPPASTSAAPPPTPAPAPAAAASSDAAAAGCGVKPLPDCPLQAWMKANANPPVMANDLPALAAAFDKMAAFAPPGYTNWASIAKDGAGAARTGDLSAAKAACRSCHDQYKAKYKAELRARKL